MKIAQVAPLHESVPPRQYGGTERVVSYLTEELVRQGHEVTLFASGDSRTTARLVPLRERSLRTDSSVVDPMPHLIHQLDCVLEHAHAFDVIHFHTDYLAHLLPLRHLDVPHVTTLHGRLDLADYHPLLERFAGAPLVSISDDQRRPLAHLTTLNWRATVHNALPPDLYRLHESPGEYLAFIGRFSPEKRADRAIEIAVRSGLPLRIAAKLDRVDEPWFRDRVEPWLDHPLVEYVGEIDDAQKNAFLGNARALLFPVDWPEPFGLVMIEAMACGTPVIAFRRGAVPEVIRDGVNGYCVDDKDAAVKAVSAIGRIDRRRCRSDFEQRFSSRRMADDYLRCYQGLERPPRLQAA
ncbi:MAG: glycosyltransferase family 4 protein [Nevskiales bacterium]|nr:glycosyltransferase family 4 protein [Nevskiales bacterium]